MSPMSTIPPTIARSWLLLPADKSERFDAAVNSEMDVVVLDVFTGFAAPAHLTESSFYEEAAQLLSPGGVMVVNVGDDAGLTFFADQARVMRSVFADVWCLADRQLFTREHAGNLVLVGGRRPLPREWAAYFEAAGPHPAGVLDGEGLKELLEGR